MYQSTQGPDGLPWLNFDTLIKRAKVTYTGQDDVIVFYNQLYNICNTYGLFMCKLKEMTLDMSICPDECNKLTISANRKALMASCLYMILRSPKWTPPCPERKGNFFLKGLDPSFNTSISKVRLLLDGVTDKTSVPEALTQECLPGTVERYYKEETGQSTIRAMTANRSGNSDCRGDNQTPKNRFASKTTTSKVDRPCGTCYAWGHLRSQCGGFARFLLFQEAASLIDVVAKSKVVNNYKADVKAKAEARMKNRRGREQLLIDGYAGNIVRDFL